jgi:hypothetical protein
MKGWTVESFRSLLLAVALIVTIIGASVSAQGQSDRHFTEKPSPDQFIPLSRMETRRGVYGAWVKPPDEREKVIVVPPPPPGWYDSHQGKPMTTGR